MKSVLRYFIVGMFIWNGGAHLQLNASWGQEDPLIENSVQDINTVIGTGITGGILGLSTLSFVGKPKEHLRHILIGGSLGIVIGVGIVAMGQATKSQEMYNEIASLPENPLDWHRVRQSQLLSSPENYSVYSPRFSWSFTF